MLFGLPVPDAVEAAREGRVKLGGCFAPGEDSASRWQCRENVSHRWTNGAPDDPLWLAAVERELPG